MVRGLEQGFRKKFLLVVFFGVSWCWLGWGKTWKKAGLDPNDFFDIDFESKEFRKKLKALYNDPEEFKSYHLSNIKPFLI
jgi:hypothetical protein